MRCELLLVFGYADKGRHYPVKVSGVEIDLLQTPSSPYFFYLLTLQKQMCTIFR